MCMSAHFLSCNLYWFKKWEARNPNSRLGSSCCCKGKEGEVGREQMNNEVENNHMHVLKCVRHGFLRNLDVFWAERKWWIRWKILPRFWSHHPCERSCYPWLGTVLLCCDCTERQCCWPRMNYFPLFSFGQWAGKTVISTALITIHRMYIFQKVKLLPQPPIPFRA